MPRAIRKAQKQKQLEALAVPPQAAGQGAKNTEGVDESDEDDDDEGQATTAVNPFDLLNAADEENDDEDDEEKVVAEQEEVLGSDEQDDLDAAITASMPARSTRRRKKKKTKAKSASIAQDETSAAAPEDDAFDAILTAHHATVAGTSADPSQPAPFHLAELLALDPKRLDPASEMRQFFGSKIVQDEQQERQANLRRSIPRGAQLRPMPRGRKSILVPVDEAWPPQIPGNLEMTLLEEDTDAGCSVFRFTHPRTYQDRQADFFQAVALGDPQLMMNLLHAGSAFHVDTLLQVSDMMRHQGNHEESGEMLARALYAFDRALLPQCKFAAGAVRIPFQIPENRPFYLCLYRHIQSLGRRGLWQTAFEFTKLLLQLSPEEDPYAAVLALDYYALKAKQFDYLSKLHAAPWHLILDDKAFCAPGTAYAIALAKWLQRPKKTKDAEYEADAARLLQQAAQRFPAIPGALFEALKAPGPVQWQNVACTPLEAAHRDLFVHRHRDIFAIPENTAFLRTALLEQDPPQRTLSQADMAQPIPENMLRHIVLLDERSLLGHVPRSVLQKSHYAFDPMPPADSMPSYMDSFLQPQQQNASGQQTGLQIPGWLRDLAANIGAGGGEGALDLEQLRAAMELDGEEADFDIESDAEDEHVQHDVEHQDEEEAEDESEQRMPGAW